MSWSATAYVKPLTNHKDGTRLSAREKLILFVLADSHNEDRGNCAWIGIEKAAQAALTSRSRFIELLKRLEERGTIRIEKREGQTHRYFFPDLPVRELDGSKKANRTPPVRQLQDPTRPTAIGPEPPENLQGTDIAAQSPPSPQIELINERLEDYYKKRWKVDEGGRRYLISPSTGERVYKEGKLA